MKKNDIKDILNVISIAIVLGIITLAACSPLIVAYWYSTCRKAQIYNKLHNTHYTCGDFFWAGDQINKQTQTIEIGK